MIKLDPIFKTKWLTALRSGDWVSFPGALGLFDTNQRCCLGVALECLNIKGEPRSDSLTSFDSHAYLPSNAQISAMVPESEVQVEYDFAWVIPTDVDGPFYEKFKSLYEANVQDPKTKEDGTFSLTLPNLNDWDAGFDFIADVIEFYG